jgi:hypothetical protein
MVRRSTLAQRIRLEIDELEKTVSIIDHHCPSIWREVHTQLLAFAKFLVRLEKDV